MLQIRLDADGAIRSLAQTATNLQQGKKLYGVLGEALRTIHKQRFEKEQASPEGEKWQPLSPKYRAKKKRNADKVLIKDGYLKNLLRYRADDNSVVFGSDRKYARLHQFGSQKASGRGSGVSARPWLGVSEQNKDYLLAKTEHFIRRIISQS
ncbi:phage virion morphogenesis protein [Mannheimia granulomatis]|uniref:Phage virion morphogenesis protein n=1 Tax=Mannheimia granulomatis TaxID=85402 RepID=A0A6G8JGM1_9PAST|nr:phage virion morphogenesis protein [Mannheimia granulomatis]QIM66340.1 phage virion morphogenesis protein [Mannheimia granulomatis]